MAEAKEIEQSEIAEKTGFTQSNISRMLSCKYKITLPNFLKLAKSVGVNFYIQSHDEKTDLNLAFEKAMAELGRRIDELPKN
ncbi:helix-turn-helix domain-containing protein [Winogradskyella sp.]|uniref:helix-turn-helix domain-containing protein n=1 Tax=Winogradskyella sp. TaxID=1883156 RepID=UPI0037048DCF